jgi:hypothetical protein
VEKEKVERRKEVMMLQSKLTALRILKSAKLAWKSRELAWTDLAPK